MQILNDQATLLLGLKSKRIQAVFSETVALVYQNSVNDDGFKDRALGQEPSGGALPGVRAPKGSATSDVVMAVWQELFDNGKYAELMTKWGIADDMLDAPGLNMAKPNK